VEGADVVGVDVGVVDRCGADRCGADREGEGDGVSVRGATATARGVPGRLPLAKPTP
jgi:hypothetical protein